jgi:hypothetical protein
LSSRKVDSRCFQNSRVANRAERAWGSFYSPQKESSYWGVRDPDMPGLGPEHVCKGLLETDIGTGYVLCLALSQDKAKEPGTRSRYQICLGNVTVIGQQTQISPTKDLAAVKKD